MLCILLEIRVFMRWCEDLAGSPEFAPQESALLQPKVEFLQYPSHSLLGSQRGNTLLLCWPHSSHREESSSWTTSA